MRLAHEDPRIDSVLLRGSRTNANAIVDEDSDYDVLYGVSDLESFRVNDEWLSGFGDILILQKPESMESINSRDFSKEVYLMQFRDGSRLDLVLMNQDLVQNEIIQDSLSVILLDKTNTLSAQTPDESSYMLSHFKLEDCVNEFLWLSFYVLKGCKRRQIMYTQNHLNMMREEFLNLITYQAQSNPGAHYKYSEKYLNAYEFNLLKQTFNSDVSNSLKILFELFNTHLSKEPFNRDQFDEVRYYIESQLQYCSL